MKNVIYFLILIMLQFPILGRCNDEFQIMPDSLGDVWGHNLTTLAGGGFVISWTYVMGDSEKLFIQLFDTDGGKIGGAVLVTADFQISYSDPVMTQLSDGGFVVCWHSWKRLDEYINISLGIFGQLFDASGQKNGSIFEIKNDLINIPTESKAVHLTNGDFVVCWLSFPTEGDYATAIFGQIFDKFGSKKYGEFRIEAPFQNSLHFPAITSLPNSEFVVFWVSATGDGSYSDIYGQIFNEYGDKISSQFQVNTNTKINVWAQPMMFLPTASLRNNDLVVCWQSFFNDNAWDIFGQRMTSVGEKIGEEFKVNTYTPSQQCFPAVAPLKTGFIVCWSSMDQVSWGSQIFGQLYDASGAKIGNEFEIDSYPDNDNLSPNVASFSECGFVVVWTNMVSVNDIYTYRIVGRYYKPHIHQLQSFSLLQPSNDKTINSSSITFLWRQPSTIRENYPWELTFNLYIDTDSNFPNSKIIKNIDDTTYTIDSLSAGKTYFWKVLAKNLAGDSLWSKQQDWGFFIKPGATLVEKIDNEMPQDFQLFQNYPNPFNSNTEIRYSLPSRKASYQVQLKVYDILGRLVKVLVDQKQSAGSYAISWDGTDLCGNRVASGIYFYSLEAGDLKSIRKMLVLQ